MKFSFGIFAITTSSALAFAPSPAFKFSSTELSMSKGESSRLQFIQQSIATAAVMTFLPGNAFAAKYGSFGSGSPEVIDPKEAIVDEEILKSAPVQKAFEAVKTYKAATESIKAELQKNSQADIGPFIRKQFDFVQLRADLNTLNSAFDEDTQRGTDRVIRLIMQDITELETANKQKEGISRSEKRLNIMFGKLEKLEKAFGDFLAFV